MVADTRAVMAAGMAEAAAMAGVMVSMAHHSSFARVLAAGGTPTVNASAGGELGSIVVGSAGLENKINGVPDNRCAFFFSGTSPRSAGLLPLRDQRQPRSPRTSLPTAGSA